MSSNIYFKITRKHIYCRLVSDDFPSGISYRSDDNSVNTDRSNSKKNDVLKSKIMGQLIKNNLNVETTYYFKADGVSNKYHGKVKAFLDEITPFAKIINISIKQ